MTGFCDEYITIYQGQITHRQLIRHQAFCLILSAREMTVTDEKSRIISGKLLVVPSMIRHRIELLTEATFVFLDPHLPFSRYHTTIANQLHADFNELQALLTGAADVPAFKTIVEHLTPCLFAAPQRVDHRIVHLTRYIQQHTDRKLTLTLLANAANLSVSRLQHLFAEQVGMTITRYVHWQRLKVSYAHILAHNTLTSAAYEGGFSDAAHFSRTFRRMFGLTPSEVLLK